MKIKGIIDECFSDYKKPAMYIAFPNCTFKCDKLNRCNICQNSELANEPDIFIDKDEIIQRYLKNPITKAIVLSGLEPFDSMLDVVSFISALRREYNCDDDVVIYTGYDELELDAPQFNSFYKFLRSLPNIYIKFGRFVMDDQPHFDEVLGVELASHNQYAKKVSEV